MVLGPPRIVEPPQNDPVDLVDIKVQLKLDDVEDPVEQAKIDSDLLKKIKAATQRCEAFTGLRLITQTLEYLFDYPEGLGVLEIPTAPVQSVVAVQFTDIDLLPAVVPLEDYRLDLSVITFNVVPPYSYRPYAVQVIAGYGTEPEDVPEILTEGIKELVAYWCLNRGGDTTDVKYEIQARTSGCLPSQVVDKWKTLRRGSA